MKYIILFLALPCLINSCTNRQHTGKNISGPFVIAPVYSDSVFFVVNAVISDKTIVKGTVGKFHNVEKKLREVYFQRFVEKKNRFRKIHVIGTDIKWVRTDTTDSTSTSNFDQYIEFDELGIFEGDTVDPITLIPLYPGHPVNINEPWKPVVPVRIAIGEGNARFNFIIDSVYLDNQGDTLARINVHFQGELKPAQEIKDARVTIEGGGWFTWNCTINQRRDTHLSAIYQASIGANEVKQLIQVDDSLVVYRERWKF